LSRKIGPTTEAFPVRAEPGRRRTTPFERHILNKAEETVVKDQVVSKSTGNRIRQTPGSSNHDRAILLPRPARGCDSPPARRCVTPTLRDTHCSNFVNCCACCPGRYETAERDAAGHVEGRGARTKSQGSYSQVEWLRDVSLRQAGLLTRFPCSLPNHTRSFSSTHTPDSDKAWSSAWAPLTSIP
jgi:hypothetical protein